MKRKKNGNEDKQKKERIRKGGETTVCGIEKCEINGERERGTGRETGEHGNKKGKRGEKEILNKIGKKRI